MLANVTLFLHGSTNAFIYVTIIEQVAEGDTQAVRTGFCDALLNTHFCFSGLYMNRWRFGRLYRTKAGPLS
jgi:hypothetical protein